MGPIGTEEAARIREEAAALAELDNIAQTDSPREILYDLSCAFADLEGPLKALLDDIDRGGSEEFTATLKAAVDGLADLAHGVRLAANNV